MSDLVNSVPAEADRAVALPPVLVEGLTDALKVELSTELVADDWYPPGAQDYSAQFRLEYYVEGGTSGLEDESEAVLELARQLGRPGPDGDGRVSLPIGHARALVIDCVNGSFDALDARSVDDARLGEVLLGVVREAGGIQEELEAFEDYALLLQFATIEPNFRGHGLSLPAVGLMIEELSRGCMCALLDPMLPGASGKEARAAARQGLSRHWSKLGFVEHGETGLMLLDFNAERTPLVPVP